MLRFSVLLLVYCLANVAGDGINIIEGNDLYLSLPNALSFYETCKLYGPDNNPVTDTKVDTFNRDSCGYIVRKVNKAHSGTWTIKYEYEDTYKETTVDVNVLEPVNMTLDNLSWDVGSSVDIIVGPANAVYCRVTDNKSQTVFEGLGPCRIVVDRATTDLSGPWTIYVGVPGSVILDRCVFYVNVGRDDARPVVTTSVARDGQSVILTCSVPAGYEVSACKFRDPLQNHMIATHGVGQDGYPRGNTSYESNAENHVCTLRILNFVDWQSGTYRCAVNTSQGMLHGFLRVTPSYIADYEPVLRSSPEFPYLGEAVTLSCSIDAPIRYCYFRSPNGTVYNVGPSILSSDYEYVGSGFSGGECGIRFHKVLQSHEGRWTCHVGLENDIHAEEKTSKFIVAPYARAWTNQFWEGNTIRVEMIIRARYQLEYCRFVRVDGLGFTWDNVPAGYRVDRDRMDSCVLYVERPTALDCQPWTVVAKRYAHSGELARTTDTRRLTSFIVHSATGFFLWVFFTVSVFMMILAAISLIPKRKRQWSYARAALIRNSFRRQPSPAQQNPAVQPNHSVTDLPYKVPQGHIDVFAREGDQMIMSCSSGMPIRYCYVIASNGTVFNAGTFQSPSPYYEYVGSGFDAGDCGIRFNNIRRSDEARSPRYVGLIIGIPCMLLIIAAITLISKSNRKWAHARAAHIRNSFRRGAPQQRQIHPPTHIITHLTLKV